MSKLVSNNTYSNILQVSWDSDNKYIAVTHTVEDPDTGDEVSITSWKTNSGTVAASGYYLSVDKKANNTYIVQLLNLIFNKGILSNAVVTEALYKLPSDFNFQDNVSYYVKNNNNFEELKVNQGQCTFTTNPATDNNFYIYQKGIEPWTSAPPLPRLVYYYSGTKWYYPLITKTGTLTWNGYIYSYDKSIGDTFGVALNNTKYVVPNKRVTAINYDIPAGTYSPSTFKSLIDNYISPNNGSRKVSNSFTATVNGQTITVNANTTIYNENNESSGSSVLTYGVNFSGEYLDASDCFSASTAHGFTNKKVYITQSKGIPYFANYMYYNITVSGIKFK